MHKKIDSDMITCDCEKNHLNHSYTYTRNVINSNENKITVAVKTSKGYNLLKSTLKSDQKKVLANLLIASVITIFIKAFL